MRYLDIDIRIRSSQLRSSHSLLNIKMLRDFIGPSTETRMYHPQKRDRSCLNRVATALQQDQSPQLGRRQADSCNLNGAWVENQLISRRALSLSLSFSLFSLLPSFHPRRTSKYTSIVHRCKYPWYIRIYKSRGKYARERSDVSSPLLMQIRRKNSRVFNVF